MSVKHTKFADRTKDDWQSAKEGWRSAEANVFEEKYVMPMIHCADRLDQVMVHLAAELETYRSDLEFVSKLVDQICQEG